MSKAKIGDRVKIHYTQKLENGRASDTSKGTQPLEITIGRNLVPIFEKAVMGMEIGEKKIIRVPPNRGHGPRRKELIIDVDKRALPQSVTPSLGQQIKIKKPDGNSINAVITGIKGDTITLDGNHPLAGKALIFEVELVDIIR